MSYEITKNAEWLRKSLCESERVGVIANPLLNCLTFPRLCLKLQKAVDGPHRSLTPNTLQFVLTYQPPYPLVAAMLDQWLSARLPQVLIPSLPCGQHCA